MQVSSTARAASAQSSTLRDITGLSAALTIKVTPRPRTRVEMGLQKWFGQGGGGPVAYMIFPVLLAMLPRYHPGSSVSLNCLERYRAESPEDREDHVSQRRPPRPCRTTSATHSTRVPPVSGVTLIVSAADNPVMVA